MTAQTNAQRQAKHKAEQAALGIKEVRGIMAHVDNHAQIRTAARRQLADIRAARLAQAPEAEQ